MKARCSVCGAEFESGDKKMETCIGCYILDILEKEDDLPDSKQNNKKRESDANRKTTVNATTRVNTNSNVNTKTKEKFSLPAWPIVILNIVLIAAFFISLCIYNQSFITVGDFLKPDIYMNFLEDISKLFLVLTEPQVVYDSVYEFIIFIIPFVILIMLIPVSIFNFADLLSSVYWLTRTDKGAKKRRRQVRWTAVKWICFWPVLIYIGMLKYMWEMVKIFLGVDNQSLERDRQIRAVSEYMSSFGTNTASSSSTDSSHSSYTTSAYNNPTPAPPSAPKGPRDGFVDPSGYWRAPGSGFVDWSGYWRNPGEGFVDADGIWRDPGSGFVDSSGYFRYPGDGFVDADGIWRDGR